MPHTAAPIAIHKAIEDVLRQDRGRLIAGLVSRLGDFQLAEDALQDALISAMSHWGRSGLLQAISAFGMPLLVMAGIGVGLCSSVIPYVCDQLAMSRLPRASFALLLSLLPATATVIGVLVLRQIPSLSDLAGVAMVMAGVALHRPAVP